MASIDKIKVNGTSYNINLPTTATPSITGLTVTTLTVNGTATVSSLMAASALILGNAAVSGTLNATGDTTLSKDLTVGGSAVISSNFAVGGNATISGGYHKGYIRVYPTTSDYSPSILFYDTQNKLTTTLTQDLQSECFEVATSGGSLILSAGLGYEIYFKEGANT